MRRLPPVVDVVRDVCGIVGFLVATMLVGRGLIWAFLLVYEEILVMKYILIGLVSFTPAASLLGQYLTGNPWWSHLVVIPVVLILAYGVALILVNRVRVRCDDSSQS